MKNKYKLFLIIICLLLSGCSVKYNLTINEDLTVNEKIEAIEKTKRMESYTRQKGKQSVYYLYDMYKRPNENINFNYREQENNTYGTAMTKHNSIDEYASKFKSDVFNNISIVREDNVVMFKTTQKELLSSTGNMSLIYDNIVVNIIIPFKVIKSNADNVNKNIYTWNINKSNKYKTIEFSYEENNKKNNVNIKINEKSYNINYAYIILISFIIFILLIIIFIYIKNKKNNMV